MYVKNMFTFTVFDQISVTSTADWCINCALYDTNMAFGTQVDHPLRTIFGYRAIANSSRDKNGSRFSKWQPLI